MKNSRFSTRDFVLDKHFQAWVLNPDDEKDQYWRTWMTENPGHDEIIAEARNTVLLLGFTNDPEANEDFVEVWKKVRQDTIAPASANVKPRWSSFYYKAAAVFVGALVLAGYLLYLQQDITVYSSAYGEIKEITLPDGSQVTLNGNSRLSLSDSWRSSGSREVFLEGEAFFDIEHIKDQGAAKKFTVHTNELEVEVLGTTFNVTSRREETEVVLNTGKVRLYIPQDTDTAEVMMVPGDLVAFDRQKGTAVVQRVNDPNLLSSWKDNQLIFESTPLFEISQILGDAYGLEIEFPNDSVKQKRFRGIFQANDIEILKQALTQTYNIKIIEKN